MNKPKVEQDRTQLLGCSFRLEYGAGKKTWSYLIMIIYLNNTCLPKCIHPCLRGQNKERNHACVLRLHMYAKCVVTQNCCTATNKRLPNLEIVGKSI